MSKLVTIQECANLLNVSIRTVRRRIKDGTLKASKSDGKFIIELDSDVDKVDKIDTVDSAKVDRIDTISINKVDKVDNPVTIINDSVDKDNLILMLVEAIEKLTDKVDKVDTVDSAKVDRVDNSVTVVCDKIDKLTEAIDRLTIELSKKKRWFRW